jgi:hypothetical protein
MKKQTKALAVPAKVHKKLKAFCNSRGAKLGDTAGGLILYGLAAKNHQMETDTYFLRKEGKIPPTHLCK